MKKIYLVYYNNGDYCEDYDEYVFEYCYSSKEQANKAIEELKQDKNFLEDIDSSYPENIRFWIKEIELIEEK